MKMVTKRKITAVFAFFLTILLLCGTAAALEGTGTQADPYKISNPADLNDLADIIQTQPDAYCIQTQNIVLDDPEILSEAGFAGKYIYNYTAATEPNEKMSNFQLIGTLTNPFKGVYDGNNYTITNLYFRQWEVRTGNYYLNQTGLFGYTEDAEIKNLHIKDSFFFGANNVGSIAGYANNTTIIDCSSNAVIESQGSRGGGLVGRQNGGEIKRSFFDGEIKPVTNVQPDGTVYVTSVNIIGGITGSVENNGKIEECYSTGVIAVGDAMGVGGIAGDLDNGSISNCYVVCNIEGGLGTGGIAGEFLSLFGNTTGEIKNCYTTGTIKSTIEIGGITSVLILMGNGDVTVENNMALIKEINGDGKRIIADGDELAEINENYAWENMTSGSGMFSEDKWNGTNVTSEQVWNTFSDQAWTGWDTTVWKLNTYGNYLLPVFVWQTEELQEDASYLKPPETNNGGGGGGSGTGNATVVNPEENPPEEPEKPDPEPGKPEPEPGEEPEEPVETPSMFWILFIYLLAVAVFVAFWITDDDKKRKTE